MIVVVVVVMVNAVAVAIMVIVIVLEVNGDYGGEHESMSACVSACASKRSRQPRFRRCHTT